MNETLPTGMDRDQVYKVLDSERRYQLRRWGIRKPDGTFIEASHGVGEWITLMEHFLSEARQAFATNPTNAPALAALRKVTSLALACFEQHGVPFRTERTLHNARDGGLV